MEDRYATGPPPPAGQHPILHNRKSHSFDASKLDGIDFDNGRERLPDDFNKSLYAKSPQSKQKGSPKTIRRVVHGFKDVDFMWILIGSFVLTINAGFINTITLNSHLQIASSHVTGLVAKASNLLAMQHYIIFGEYCISYICFLTGALIGGMIINYETFYLGRNYGRALFLLASVQGLALIIEHSYDNSIFFIWACTFCNGLQNSLTTKFGGSVAIRTSHLTGASTDLGIALGHIMKGRSDEWWKVYLHGIAVVGFFLGGFAGFFAFERFEHAALLVNVCLSTICALIHTFYISYHERLPVITVLESKTDIRIHKHRKQLSDPLDLSPSKLRALQPEQQQHQPGSWRRISPLTVPASFLLPAGSKRAQSPVATSTGLVPASARSPPLVADAAGQEVASEGSADVVEEQEEESLEPMPEEIVYPWYAEDDIAAEEEEEEEEEELYEVSIQDPQPQHHNGATP